MASRSASATQSISAPAVYASSGVRWEILAGGSDLISTGDAELPLARWLRDGRAAAVKQGVGRVVYRLDLPHGSYYVKQVHQGGPWQWLKRRLRGGACRREFDKARELTRRGVPAIAPLALGERRRGWWSCDDYLITAAVPQALSLDEFLAEVLPKFSPTEQAGIRRRLIDAVARLCAAAHDAGVYHDDLHGGNILCRGDTCRPDFAGAPELFFVDLPGVELSLPLDAARTRSNLAMLCAGFGNRMSESERRRFWNIYCRTRMTLSLPDADAFAAEIRAAAAEHGHRILDGRDKRVWGNNRDYYSLRLPTGTAYAVRDLSRGAVEALLRDPDSLWRAHADRPLKISFGSLVVAAELRDPTTGRSHSVVVKRLRAKSFWRRCADFFRRGRALQGWYRGHALAARGIPTARPLAVYLPRGAGGDGYLITERLDAAEDVHLYAWDLARRSEPERRRRVRQTCDALGRIVGRLHNQGFTHRDLKANNLMVRETPGGVEAFLIDLDALRQGSRPKPNLCCRDLARTALSAEMHPWLSRTDRLRFLRSYLKQYAPTSQREWKPWWRMIAAQVRAELAIIRQAGRPVT